MTYSWAMNNIVYDHEQIKHESVLACSFIAKIFKLIRLG